MKAISLCIEIRNMLQLLSGQMIMTIYLRSSGPKKDPDPHITPQHQQTSPLSFSFFGFSACDSQWSMQSRPRPASLRCASCLVPHGRQWCLHWWGLQLLWRRACVAAVVSAAVLVLVSRVKKFECIMLPSNAYTHSRRIYRF